MEVVCSICLDNYKPEQAILAVDCGHVFHEQCLLEWMKKSPTCPICNMSCGPTNKKVYLNFEDKPCKGCSESEGMIADLFKRIDELESTAEKLKSQLDTKKNTKIVNNRQSARIEAKVNAENPTA